MEKNAKISLIITRLVSRVRKQAEEALSSVSHKVTSQRS
jgi:hypothetical protein